MVLQYLEHVALTMTYDIYLKNFALVISSEPYKAELACTFLVTNTKNSRVKN